METDLKINDEKTIILLLDREQVHWEGLSSQTRGACTVAPVASSKCACTYVQYYSSEAVARVDRRPRRVLCLTAGGSSSLARGEKTTEFPIGGSPVVMLPPTPPPMLLLCDRPRRAARSSNVVVMMSARRTRRRRSERGVYARRALHKNRERRNERKGTGERRREMTTRRTEGNGRARERETSHAYGRDRPGVFRHSRSAGLLILVHVNVVGGVCVKMCRFPGRIVIKYEIIRVRADGVPCRERSEIIR